MPRHHASKTRLEIGTTKLMMKIFKQGSYRHQVAVLVTGTAAAQALPIAASPILTRLFAPEDFGLLAVYSATAAILMSLSTAQYELAITLPAKDENAASVVSLCIKVCSVFSLFLLFIILFFNQTIARWLGHPEIASWLYLLPATIFASGVFQTYTFWCNRRSAYGVIAKQSFQLSVITVFSSIAFGLISVHGGQILGIVAGKIAAAASLFHTVRKTDGPILSQGFGQSLRPVAKRYKAHPLYFLPAQLINEFALQLPIFMISSLFLISSVGYFAIAYRLVTLPTTLIASAIGNVYRQRISETYQKYGQFRDIYKRTLLITLLASIVPFSVLYFIAPSLFAVVFGEQWRVAGSYAQILVISTFFSFITTPLDKGAIVVGAKRYNLAWSVGRFLCYGLLWIVANAQKIEIETVLWSFVATNIFLYTIDAVFQYRFSGNHSKAVDSTF